MRFVFSERTRNVCVSAGSRTTGTVTHIQDLRPAGVLGTFDFVCLQNLFTFYTQKRSTGKDSKTGFTTLKGTRTFTYLHGSRVQ